MQRLAKTNDNAGVAKQTTAPANLIVDGIDRAF